MKREKLLIVTCFLIAITLLMAGLIGAILRLINLPAILIAILFLGALAIQRGIPWWKGFIKKNLVISSEDNKSLYKPKNKKQAASRSLKSIDQLLSLIEDKVSAEALKQEQERVCRELTRGDLVVVIFGVGSSGKTSLIRALLNEIVGQVSPAMGSTTTNKSYRLRLRGLERGIKIYDTPGILEGGKEGIARKKQAFQKAGNADLMIVVIDSDLRAAEFELIRELAKIGKRIILVINKIDLRGESEEAKLTETIRMKCREFISRQDVICCSASPQTIPRAGGKPYQPAPEIDQLVRRLARVLYEEGEELIADNILLQCRNLGKDGKRLLNQQRTNTAKSCVDRYSWISSGVVILTPLPGVDMLGAAAVNTQMVVEIAKVYGVKITRGKSQELAISVGKSLAALGIVKGGVTLIGTALSLNLPTFAVGKIVQGISAAWLTRIAGASFITFFQQDQDWGDGGIQEVVQHHYNLNKREESLNKFIESALEKIVKPLAKNKFKQLPPHRRPR